MNTCVQFYYLIDRQTHLMSAKSLGEQEGGINIYLPVLFMIL